MSILTTVQAAGSSAAVGEGNNLPAVQAGRTVAVRTEGRRTAAGRTEAAGRIEVGWDQ